MTVLLAIVAGPECGQPFGRARGGPRAARAAVTKRDSWERRMGASCVG